MNVRKHMSAPPITISEDTDFKAALGLMQKRGIRRLPVVDEQGALMGIVAERDLLVAADRYLSSPVEVAQIMTREVVTVGDSMPVVEAAILMIDRKIGGLPVVDASQRLLGIITETDLLQALTGILKRQGEASLSATARRSAPKPAKKPAPKTAAKKKKKKPAAGKRRPRVRRKSSAR